MDSNETKEITVKEEPIENNGTHEESTSKSQINATRIEPTASSLPGPLRYVSRRGRPPGGGYSMKSHAHYVSFSSIPLSTSTDIGRQLSNGTSSSLSPQDLLKSGTSASTDNLDIRRFGFPGFETDKNTFRCDGCDVVFSSRDTYAMHMLLRAKNESCVALPTSAISFNPENPTPREKFERELRQQTMVTAIRSQATALTKAATPMLSKSEAQGDSLTSMVRSSGVGREDFSGSGSDRSLSFNSLFSVDSYGLYVDPRQYRRVLEEYGLRASASTGAMQTMIEQFSCTDCGEIFTSKDALAMHMMYHTRDDDRETSTNISWADMRSSVSHKQESACSSVSSSSPTQCTGSRKTNKTEPSVAAKREVYKTEERELTAERVAELKRIAVESSLRSPLKKSTTSRQSTRPKSVSQDMPVTTSAQDRPLSADDVRRFIMSESKRDHERSGSILFNNYVCADHEETRQSRKRSHSTLDHGSAFEVKRLATDQSKGNRNRHDNMFYNLFCRNKTANRIEDSDKDKDDVVRDSNVPSAADPPDSDDISEISSVTESSPKRDGQSTAYVKESRTIRYLDAIMAQEAVLVPIDPTISKGDIERTMESKKIRSGEDNQGTQASAIDFSIDRRESTGGINRSSWYAPQSNHDNSEIDNKSDASRSQLSASTKSKADRSEHHLNLYFQYQNFDRSTTGQTENRAQNSGNRLLSSSRQGFSADRNHQENDGPSRNWLEESTARVSEARYCPHCEILFLDVTLFHLHMGLHNVNNPWQCNTCGLVCSGRLDFNTHVLHY